MGAQRNTKSFAGRMLGVTMIELMIAIVLSLVISAALSVLLVNMSRAHSELDRSSRQIENGRYAIELLAEEVRLAGFYSNVKQSGAVISHPDPCEKDLADLGWANAPITIPSGVQGFIGTTDVPACVTSHVSGTALVALRRLSAVSTAPAAVAGGDPFLQTSNCSADPFVPPLILGDKPADFTLKQLNCTTLNSVRRYLSRIYYVAPCSDCVRDTIPTLKRLELSGGNLVETALAEGIQEVQFEYGFDTNSDGVPDVYRTQLSGVIGAPENEWANVMSVRIWLLSRSSEPTPGYSDSTTYSLGLYGTRGPFSDRFKRRVYTQVVRLNSPSGWRE